ncbi:MAG: hypothetical protein AB7V04_04085 [Desulfomonilaceae bacterium]
MEYQCIIRRLSSISVILLVFLIAQFSIHVSLCYPKEDEKHSFLLSVEANNEPLKGVLARVSKASGYAISINEEAEALPITVKLEKLTIYDAIKRIIEALNSPGYTLQVTQRKITITIVSRKLDSAPSPTLSAEKTTSSQAHSENPGDIEAIPPTADGGRAITLSELKASESKEEPSSPQTEALPPTEPAGAGMQLWELQTEGTTQDGDPSVEAIPATKSQNAITLGELQAMSDNTHDTDPFTTEAIPPTEPEGDGMTLGELHAVLPETSDTHSGTE